MIIGKFLTVTHAAQLCVKQVWGASTHLLDVSSGSWAATITIVIISSHFYYFLMLIRKEIKTRFFIFINIIYIDISSTVPGSLILEHWNLLRRPSNVIWSATPMLGFGLVFRTLIWCNFGVIQTNIVNACRQILQPGSCGCPLHLFLVNLDVFCRLNEVVVVWGWGCPDLLLGWAAVEGLAQELAWSFLARGGYVLLAQVVRVAWIKVCKCIHLHATWSLWDAAIPWILMWWRRGLKEVLAGFLHEWLHSCWHILSSNSCCFVSLNRLGCQTYSTCLWLLTLALLVLLLNGVEVELGVRHLLGVLQVQRWRWWVKCGCLLGTRVKHTCTLCCGVRARRVQLLGPRTRDLNRIIHGIVWAVD